MTAPKPKHLHRKGGRPASVRGLLPRTYTVKLSMSERAALRAYWGWKGGRDIGVAIRRAIMARTPPGTP